MLEYMKWGESMEKNIQSKPQPKKGLKKRRIKEILFIVSMIVCLGIGFIFGYILNSQNNSIIKSSGDTTILDEAYHILKNDWYNPNDTEVNIEGNSIAALVSSLGDIHSSYFTFEESLAFNQSVDGNFDGIGIAFISLNSGILVTEVYPNSPASESNIQVGDIINKVDETDIVGKDSEEVKELVRGEAGTIVKLSGYRNNENFVADVKRGSVETAVNGEIREENGKKFGYITITTFGSSTGDEVKAYLDQFVDAKLNNIVFDLRGNGGGYLVAANDVLNLFIDEGKSKLQSKPVLYRTGTQEVFEIQGDMIRIGRNPAISEICISGNRGIGRIHAVLYVNNGQVGIVDNDSKNKTYVNGEQLKPGDTPRILSPGDKIQLADEELEFRISQ